MKILITGHLPDEVVAPLVQQWDVTMHPLDQPMDRNTILSLVPDIQGLICMITDAVDEVLLDRATELKMVANFGVGFNNIDVPAATARGIMVSNTPGVLTDATADLTMALILAVGRRVVEGDKYTRQGKFKFWAPFHFLGHEITGKTLGIVGMGRIGAAVACRAAGFNMPVIYHNRQPLPEEKEQSLGVRHVDLETLLQQSDFVSMHVPLTAETHHLIGARQFSAMKPDGFLINTSRGPVVDETALFDALVHREIGGAGLDVYENEPALTPGLEKLDNVILLPHMGSATQETRRRMGAIVVENMIAGLEGRMPPNCLNPVIVK
jgi:glyoxylate reductase